MTEPAEMPLSPQDETLDDLASLYSLGLLQNSAAAEFEIRLASEPAAREALHRCQASAALIAESLEPAAPPPRLKERVLSAIFTAQAVQGFGLGAIRSEEGRWKPADVPGVSYKALYYDRASGLLTMLVRMEPGASYPAHIHSRAEQCLVLEGDLIHGDHAYDAGDFTWAEAGSLDPALTTRNGNLLLIIGAPENERLPP